MYRTKAVRWTVLASPAASGAVGGGGREFKPPSVYPHSFPQNTKEIPFEESHLLFSNSSLYSYWKSLFWTIPETFTARLVILFLHLQSLICLVFQTLNILTKRRVERLLDLKMKTKSYFAYWCTGKAGLITARWGCIFPFPETHPSHLSIPLLPTRIVAALTVRSLLGPKERIYFILSFFFFLMIELTLKCTTI